MLFASVIVASAIEPVADWGKRYRIPRAVTVVIVYAAVILLFFSMITLMIEPLTEQIRGLAQALPSMFEWVETRVGTLTDVDQSQVASLQQGLSRLGDNLTQLSVNIFQGAGTIVTAIGMVLFVFVVAFYLVIEEGALKKFFHLVVPAEHWPFVQRVIEQVQRGVGRWVLAQLALGLVVGVVVGIGLWLMGVPYALLLGLMSGLFEIIPVIGPILAAIPGVLVGLSQSVFMGVAVLGFYLVVQQLENQVLIPNIMRRAIGLHPIVTILAVLLGARLVGVAGAILAVPLATVVSIVLSDIFKGQSDEELAG